VIFILLLPGPSIRWLIEHRFCLKPAPVTLAPTALNALRAIFVISTSGSTRNRPDEVFTFPIYGTAQPDARKFCHCSKPCAVSYEGPALRHIARLGRRRDFAIQISKILPRWCGDCGC